MVAILYPRRLYELRDVTQPGIGLPDQGVPQLQSSNSSFVVQTIAAGGGGSFSLGESNLGNTLGDTGVTGTRVVLAGIGNLTLSQATDVNGGTISISGGTAGAGFSAGVSGGNTAGDTGATGTRLVFAGGQSITLSQATDANGGTVTISGASTSQSAQTQNRFNLTLDGNTSGALAQISSGTMTLAGGNGITLSQAGNAVTISGNTFSQSVQPETQTFIGGISASNTLYTSGTVNIVGSGIVTVQSGTGQRVIVNASQSVQPETQTFVGGIAASDTTYTSGTVRITGVGGGVTVSSNTGQRVDISVAAQSVQTQSAFNLTISGNTSGAGALISSGTMTLAGGNNITVSQAGNAITISGPNVGGAQTGISGIAASNTTYTSGTVTFTGVGGGITVSSNTGQRIDLSVAAQTNQSGGAYAVGNTYSSSSGTFDARTISIRGDGIISVAATNSGWRISASQSVQAETQTFVGGIIASDTTYTSGSIRFTGVGGGVTVSSNTGQRVDISVAAQTVESQSFGMSNIGNTSGTTGIASGGQVRFLLAGGNNITLSQSLNGASGTITISAPNTVAQTNQTLGMYAVQNTTGQSSSTTMDARTLSVAGDGAVSVGYSAGSLRISAPTQTVQTQNMVAVTLSGNTSGAQALISSGTLTLAGGNNITVSQAGNAVTISGPNVGGAQTGISGLANSETTYTSGSVTFSALGALTIRSTTGQHFQFSVNSQSVQPETQTFVGGIANSQTTYTSGTVSLSELGAITIRSTTGNQFQLSVNAQTVESQSIGMSNVGNTSGTTGVASGGQVRFVLAGGNNVTLSQSLNGASGTITISAPNAQTGISGIANSQTTYTSGTVSWSELGAVTIRSTTGNQYQISVNSQTVESQSIGMSNIGNTSGTTGIASGGQVRFVFAGGNNITLSQSLNGASGTITISAPNLGAGAMSAGVSNLGNTAGSTGVTGTRLVLVGTNNISLSQSTDANGGTVSINNTVSAFQAGVSTGGNTTGDTGVTGTRLVLVGTNPITLSQATGANGATVSIDAPATSSLVGTNGISVSTNGSTISVMQITQTSIAPFGMSPLVTGQQGQGTLHIAPIQLPNIQFDRIALGMQISNASNSSFSFTLSQWVGFYTKNASSISLVASTSVSTNFSGSGTVGSYSLYGGPAQQTIPWTTTLTGSDYYIGIVVRTTTGGGAGHSVSQLCLSKFTNSAWSGVIGQGSNATAQAALGLGVYSASTSGIPNSIAFTQIQGSGSMVLRAPAWQLRSGTV